ncbi:MAG: hypothetical protein ACI9UA_002507 [Pseudoalteromonas tetraodonis]|jgi:hypothetical protein
MKDSACKDYHMTRRRMLQAAGGTGAAMLGMPIQQLFAEIGKQHAPKAESMVLFWMGGGMSHLDTWDPKPGRPTQGEFNPINTSADGVQISEIFPKLAKQMHHCSVVRSIAGTNGDHGRATYELQTSYGQSGNLVHPGMGSVVVHEREPLGDLPAFISIGGMAPRSGYLGQQCEAYYIGRPGERDPYLAFPEGISQAQGNRRLDVLAKMNSRSSKSMNSAEMKATEIAISDAVDLMKSPALKAFDLEKEDSKTMERYGNTEFGRGALLARKLVETGVRFVQVNRGGFDNHNGIFTAMQNHGDVMDPALASLIEDLSSSGRLDKTLVMVLSEFGRTPRINDAGGRDHHARCFSCLMAGGGTKGGTVVGASDEDGVMPAERPVKVPDLHATICHALGVDFKKEILTPLGRPLTLVKKGAEPVAELFG